MLPDDLTDCAECGVPIRRSVFGVCDECRTLMIEEAIDKITYTRGPRVGDLHPRGLAEYLVDQELLRYGRGE